MNECKVTVGGMEICFSSSASAAVSVFLSLGDKRDGQDTETRMKGRHRGVLGEFNKQNSDNSRSRAIINAKGVIV